MRRGVGVSQGLTGPARCQVEVKILDDDTPGHFRRQGCTGHAQTHVPVREREQSAPGGLDLGLASIP